MNKLSSVYLDVLRILAAGYVFIYHIGSVKIEGKSFFSSDRFNDSLGLKHHSAHFFVIIFFVLSGFLITTSANRPGINFKRFMIDRLGRLYSVLIPALLFTYLVAVLFLYLGLPGENFGNFDNLPARFLLNISFLSQVWTLCATPPLNTPFWSLSYEFSYYLIISIFLLIRQTYKWVALFLVFLLCWPKVLLLFPAWFAGSCLYYLNKKVVINRIAALVLFLATSILIALTIHSPESFPFVKEESDNQFMGFTLFFSWNYIADYLFAALVVLNIYSFFNATRLLKGDISNRFIIKIFSGIKTAGNCTYTLYLFHLPLLFLFAAFIPYEKDNNFHVFLLIIVVSICVYFIARITEWRVSLWRKGVEAIVNKLEGLFRYAFSS